jgi:hypothetical protein
MNQPPPTTAAANSTSSKYFDLARKIKEIEMVNKKCFTLFLIYHPVGKCQIIP